MAKPFHLGVSFMEFYHTHLSVYLKLLHKTDKCRVGERYYRKILVRGKQYVWGEIVTL